MLDEQTARSRHEFYSRVMNTHHTICDLPHSMQGYNIEYSLETEYAAKKHSEEWEKSGNRPGELRDVLSRQIIYTNTQILSTCLS